VSGRPSLKELGKLTPYLWKKGCPRAVTGPRGWEPRGVAVTRPTRLFTKNTGLCQPARGGIGADACPVPEG
jgi:hypothetical protein